MEDFVLVHLIDWTKAKCHANRGLKRTKAKSAYSLNPAIFCNLTLETSLLAK